MRESEPEKRRKPLIYIRLTNVQEHLYPHKTTFGDGFSNPSSFSSVY